MTFINQRQYLDLKHRDELRHLRTVSVEDFKDKSDRTLTISRERLPSDGTESFRHIFFLNGLLHLHIYEVDESGQLNTISWRPDNILPTRDVEPLIRRGPGATDYEFATIMENLHIPILFYVPESSYGHMEPVDGEFLGHIKPSWIEAG